MRTYYVNYYENGWHKIELKADSIDNLRKRIVAEKLGLLQAEVSVMAKGRRKPLGYVSYSIKYKTYTWTNKDGTSKISPKTGKISVLKTKWRLN